MVFFNAKFQGAASVDIFRGPIQTKEFRVHYGVICGSLGVFFKLFLCMDGKSSVWDIWTMFLEFLEVLDNELTHYFDPNFLFWGSWYCCYIRLLFLGKGFRFWEKDAYVILSLVSVSSLFWAIMQICCYLGLWLE